MSTSIISSEIGASFSQPDIGISDLISLYLAQPVVIGYAWLTLPAVGLCHNPFANASFPVYLDIKALKGLIVFSEMQSSSTDRQGPDKEPMSHN
ncbi:MAG: hypothetical protein EZS28_029542, partial [Streblomastix strix]